MNEQPPARRPVRILPTIIIAAVALTAGILAARLLLHLQPPADDLSASRFPVARSLQPFHLVDHHGDAFDNDTLKGHWTFLFFGYTHCPDVCPTTLAVLNAVAQKTGDIRPPARFVFITVDPVRDTPEQLASFVSYFNKQFIGVTGSDGELDKLTGQLGVLHVKVPDQADPENYLVDHSASVFLVDPRGNYHALFTPPLSADAISTDFHKIVKEYH
jgi:protein SCO1/2